MEKKKSFAYGWSLIVCWFFAWAIYNFTNTVSLALFRDQVAAVHGYSTVAALDMSTAAGIIVSVMFLVVPKIMKKMGARALMFIGMVGLGLTYALTPFAPNGVVLGLMIALLNLFGGLACIIPTVELAGRWFPRRKGFAMGCMTAAGIVASGVMLPIYNSLYNSMGVTKTMMIYGVVIVIYGIVCLFWIKETPESMGLDPDGMPMTDEDRAALDAAKNQKSDWNYKMLLTNAKFWVFAAGWVCEYIAIVGFSSCYIAFLVSIGIEQNTVVAAATMIGILQCLFSVVSGVVDTKLGASNAALVLLAIQFVCFAVMGIAGAALPVMFVLFLMLVEMGTTGCPNNLQPSQGMNLLGARNYSSALVLLQIINSLRLAGNFVIARSLSWTGGYQGAVIAFAVLVVIGAVLIKIVGDKPLPLPKKSEA